MSLQTSLFFRILLNHDVTVQGSPGTFAPEYIFNDILADGTGLDQADVPWYDKARSLAATSENLDLASGSLTDGYGNTATFAKLKMLYIKNLSTTAGETLKIGGGTNPFLLFDDGSDIYDLGPNGIYFVWEPSLAGLPVTAATGDILKIDSGAATLTYDIAMVGASA